MEVFFARMVMPRSRSRSFESMTRSSTCWLARIAPACLSRASTSVVLPWSTCAMIAILRMSYRNCMRGCQRWGGRIIPPCTVHRTQCTVHASLTSEASRSTFSPSMPSSIDLAARLSAVVGLQQDILDAAPDSQKVMDLVVTRIAELTGGDGAAIALVDGEDLAIGAIDGVVPYTKDERTPIAGSLAADALRSGDIIRRDDLLIDSAGSGRPIQIASAMTVPLLRDGYFVGVVETFATTAHAFDDLAAYTLQLLGGMTSGALMVSRAFREKHDSEARYRMLFERN